MPRSCWSLALVRGEDRLSAGDLVLDEDHQRPYQPGGPPHVEAESGAGAELVDVPPAPDTPLARVLAYAAEHGEEAVTEDVIARRDGGRL